MNIQPASNNQLKSWKKLQMGKYRKKYQQFTAEGLRCVEQILANKFVEIAELILDEAFDEADLSLNSNLPVYRLSHSDFLSVSDTENPQGVLAICKQPSESNIKDLTGKNGLIVAFDAIQDPGNLGTMIRTSAWFGVSGLLIGDGTVDLYHPKVVRSTAGATGSLPYLKGELDEMLSKLEEGGWNCCLLDGSESAADLHDSSKNEKTVIVVGNEGSGIQEKLFKPNRQRVRIPGGTGFVESLNAAVALSIGLYHFSD